MTIEAPCVNIRQSAIGVWCELHHKIETPIQERKPAGGRRPASIYQGLRGLLHEELVGRFRVGERLPSERQLARTFQVSPVTISRALQELSRDGIIYRVPGSGTFPCEGAGQEGNVELKESVQAALAVNHELILLYWGIGRDILQRQHQQGWGTKIIERLSVDLRHELPDMTGLSLRNLKYMRTFAEAWPDEPIVQQLVAQLPWGHNVRLLEYVKSREPRLWYARATIEHGWSRNVLVHHIEGKLFERQGKAATNFERTLPSPQSDLARQLLKDPYNFEFLTLQRDAEERELEKGLVDHIRKFLLELGAGFAFLGSQYHLEIADEDYSIDLLFYHVKLRSYVVIELKNGKFKPEYAGKMNFYLAAVDDLPRHPDDAPSIGLILCKEKKEIVVEYALRNTSTPIGISAYQITEALPELLKGSLPTVEQLEAELAKTETDAPEGGTPLLQP